MKLAVRLILPVFLLITAVSLTACELPEDLPSWEELQGKDPEVRLDKNFPDDVALYEKNAIFTSSTVKKKNTYLKTYRVVQEIEDKFTLVDTFYQRQFKVNGWHMTSSDTNEVSGRLGASMFARKGDRHASIEVEMISEGLVQVVIEVDDHD